MLSRLLPVALGGVAVLLLAGCTQTAAPDATDAARVAALEASPPFAVDAFGAAWEATAAREAPASTNVVAYRGGVRTVFALDEVAADDSLAPGWATVFPLGQAVLGELRANGWDAVAVSCEAPASASSSAAVQIDAVAPLAVDGGDVVAAVSVRIGTGAGEVEAEAVVPFHTEASDPWGGAPLGEDTCLDATTPPSGSVAAGTPLSLSDVPR